MKDLFKLKTNKILFPNQHNGIFLQICRALNTPYTDCEETYMNLLKLFVANKIDFEMFTLTDNKQINWPNMIFGKTKRSNCVDNAYVAHSLGRYFNFPGRILAYGGYDYFNPASHLEHFIYVVIDTTLLTNPIQPHAYPFIIWNKPDSGLGDMKLRFKSFDFILDNLNSIINNKIYGSSKYLLVKHVYDPLIFPLTWIDINVLEENFNKNGLTHAELFNMMPAFGIKYNDYKNRKAQRLDKVIEMAKKSKLNETEDRDAAIFAKIDELFEKESRNTKQALAEAGIEIEESENMTPGNIIASAFKEGIQQFGSQEAFEEHIEKVTEEYEKLIAQTSLAESYFEQKRLAHEAIDNDPLLSSHNFAYVGGKAIRLD